MILNTIFPFIDTVSRKDTTVLPLYKDIKTDERGLPVFKNGEPVFVSGNEALKSWCRFALLTERKRYRCLSRNYGNDVMKLVGKPFLPATTEAEAKRYIRECLTANRYIKSVENIKVEFDGLTLSATFTINTIYGRSDISV